MSVCAPVCACVKDGDLIRVMWSLVMLMLLLMFMMVLAPSPK